ncbi:MAG: hypothetical protein MZW92_69035 [Comamonadaceae bacterium]|nr:hypothetical protein [Comamonadaceae bacterium]
MRCSGRSTGLGDGGAPIAAAPRSMHAALRSSLARPRRAAPRCAAESQPSGRAGGCAVRSPAGCPRGTARSRVAARFRWSHAPAATALISPRRSAARSRGSARRAGGVVLRAADGSGTRAAGDWER